MSHPYAKEAKTGQQRADARYTPVPNTTPTGVLVDDARVTSRGEQAEDCYIAAPARQISQTGKVRK
jgi:hypothetical protein